MQVFVLSPPRAMSSLMAEILARMGVDMGVRLPENSKKEYRTGASEYFHYEDLAPFSLDAGILATAGFNLRHPLKIPRHKSIIQAGIMFRSMVRKVISFREAKGSEKWGWKSPYQALTADVWHSYFNNPKYIVVCRPINDIVFSYVNLNVNRRPKEYVTQEEARKLIKEWYKRLFGFLERSKPSYFLIKTKDLVDPVKNYRILCSLAEFLEFSSYEIEEKVNIARSIIEGDNNG